MRPTSPLGTSSTAPSLYWPTSGCLTHRSGSRVHRHAHSRRFTTPPPPLRTAVPSIQHRLSLPFHTARFPLLLCALPCAPLPPDTLHRLVIGPCVDRLVRHLQLPLRETAVGPLPIPFALWVPLRTLGYSSSGRAPHPLHVFFSLNFLLLFLVLSALKYSAVRRV